MAWVCTEALPSPQKNIPHTIVGTIFYTRKFAIQSVYMKSITKTIGILFLIIGFFEIGHSQGIEFVHDKKFSEVLALAKKERKLIFMDCYTTWCGPCKRLAAQVFPDPEVGEYFNANFINTKFDMEKDEGPEIAARFGVRAYPTLLWFNGEGNVVNRVVGGLDPAGLIEAGRKSLDPTPGILNGMRVRYNNGDRDADFLADYVNTSSAAGEKTDGLFKEYLEKLSTKQLNEEKHARTIFNLTNDIKSQGLQYLMANKEAYKKLLGDETFNKKINAIATKAVTESPKADDKALFDGAIELLKNNKAPDTHEMTLKLSMAYYLKMNDMDNYDKNASAFIKKYAPKNAVVLNDVAWNYFLNVNESPQLSKATKWAYEALNIENKYTYNLTYAYLLYKQKNYKEAEKACDYAIIRAGEENVQPSSAKALKESIKKTLQESN
jgi:thiol-disulfide isomerase/thioredoxin